MSTTTKRKSTASKSKKAASKKTASKKAATKKATAKKTSSKKSATKKATSKKKASQKKTTTKKKAAKKPATKKKTGTTKSTARKKTVTKKKTTKKKATPKAAATDVEQAPALAAVAPPTSDEAISATSSGIAWPSTMSELDQRDLDDALSVLDVEPIAELDPEPPVEPEGATIETPRAPVDPLTRCWHGFLEFIGWRRPS